MKKNIIMGIAGAALAAAVGSAIAACVVDIRYTFSIMIVCVVCACVGGAALQMADKS